MINKCHMACKSGCLYPGQNKLKIPYNWNREFSSIRDFSPQRVWFNNYLPILFNLCVLRVQHTVDAKEVFVA